MGQRRTDQIPEPCESCGPVSSFADRPAGHDDREPHHQHDLDRRGQRESEAVSPPGAPILVHAVDPVGRPLEMGHPDRSREQHEGEAGEQGGRAGRRLRLGERFRQDSARRTGREGRRGILEHALETRHVERCHESDRRDHGGDQGRDRRVPERTGERGAVGRSEAGGGVPEEVHGPGLPQLIAEVAGTLIIGLGNRGRTAHRSLFNTVPVTFPPEDPIQSPILSADAFLATCCRT